MKNTIISLIMCSLTFFVVACDNDEKTAKPSLILTEVGHDNSMTCHPGHDLHLEADIEAEGLIKYINVEIESTVNSSIRTSEMFDAGKYIGIRNAEFHEHIDIPENMPIGKCYLKITVCDEEGQITMTEQVITIVEDDGEDEEHEHEHEHDHHN